MLKRLKNQFFFAFLRIEGLGFQSQNCSLGPMDGDHQYMCWLPPKI